LNLWSKTSRTRVGSQVAAFFFAIPQCGQREVIYQGNQDLSPRSGTGQKLTKTVAQGSWRLTHRKQAGAPDIVRKPQRNRAGPSPPMRTLGSRLTRARRHPSCHVIKTSPKAERCGIAVSAFSGPPSCQAWPGLAYHGSNRQTLPYLFPGTYNPPRLIEAEHPPS